MPELNIKPGTLFIGDNLNVLHGINTGSVDLVYLDPPFHSEKIYLAPLDSAAAGQRFDDVFYPSMLKSAWVEDIRTCAPGVYAVCEASRAAVGNYRWAYLIFMAARLLEIHRVLKDTGSCWLHCDWHADGWLRALMDAIFGAGNLRNIIPWCYSGPSNTPRHFPRKHDTLLWYSKGRDWTFNVDAARVPHKRQTRSWGTKICYGGGERSQAEAIRLEDEALAKGKVVEDWWTGFPSGAHISKNERVGWRTQKPLALLERIINVSSRPEDVVLDPFCGCATAMVAAQKLGRRWVGIDIDPLAQKVTLDRMIEHAGLLDAEQELQWLRSPPERTDDGATACTMLEREFQLRSQDALRLSGPQKERLRRQLYARSTGKCSGYRLDTGERFPCVAPVNFLPIEFFEMDHIRPKKRGGRDIAANFQLICAPCNGAKGVR